MSDAVPWRAALTSPATVAALLYVAAAVRLLSSVRHREDDAARARRADNARADTSPQRYSFA
jgi:hypothetical protein